MRHAATAIRLAAAALAVAALAGCSESTRDTAPAVAQPPAPSWDPCVGIPDDLVRTAGLDPATKRKDIAAAPEPGWASCGWSNKDAALRVYFSESATAQQIREAQANHDFADVTLGDRTALQYRQDTGADCTLAFDTADGGQVRLRVDSRPLPADSPRSACELLRDTATPLVPVLPK
ncbi:hypothetical protein GCM10023318_18690 [Nocardia callitridis]|uniref:DUF3558 domain-containing protein n=2 Tax=Nocardia callitridis TaxID=648753 RepID=A0ABP9K5U0_9NOCA